VKFFIYVKLRSQREIMANKKNAEKGDSGMFYIYSKIHAECGF